MQQKSATPVSIGLDDAKDRLDVHVHPLRQTFRVPYDENGIARLVTRPRRRIGRALRSATCPAIASLSSASEKKRRLRSRARIQRSTTSTATSTFALSRGLRTRVGRIAVP